MNKNQKTFLLKLLIAGILSAVFFFIPVEGYLKALLFLIPIVIAGYDVYLSAGKKLVSLEFLSEDFLMGIAAAGIFVTGLIWTGQFVEAPLIIIIYQLGKLLSRAFSDSVKKREETSLNEEKRSILHDALERKAPIERKLKRFSKLFAPLFITAAIIVIIIPPLFRALYNLPPQANVFVYAAMTLVAISCPSYITGSVPFCFRNALSSLLSKDIFLKDQNNIESLSTTRIILFDSEDNKERAGDMKPIGISRMEVLFGDHDERLFTLEKTLRQRQRKTYLAYLSKSPDDKRLIQRADTGIIIGHTDVKEMLEFSDVVIQNDAPEKLQDLLLSSKNCMTLVKTNIALPIVVKLILTALLAIGILPITIAVAANVAVYLLCLLNSKRAL
ncbi:MAG: hypothetical protein IJI65_02155 [Lachnospiraceae bacterium]|nr:hypothetical protein [Lachnospiraceae bacterium]